MVLVGTIVASLHKAAILVWQAVAALGLLLKAGALTQASTGQAIASQVLSSYSL